MTKNHQAPWMAIALCACALALAPAASAKADSTVACATLFASALDAPGGVERMGIVRTENLERWQARPWARIPLGVALWVKAPRGTTAADLHNMAVSCMRASDGRSPLCVPGAAIRVARDGGLYVLRITSDSRSVAREIQQRASQRS